MEKTQVLIVGGGVVGLAASLFLSDQGLDTVLIERHPTTCIHPRARGVNPRTMEILRAYGLESDIKKGGECLDKSRGIYFGSNLMEILNRNNKSYYIGMGLTVIATILLGVYSFLGLKFLGYGLLGLLSILGILVYYIYTRFIGKNPVGHVFCTQDFLEPIILKKAREKGAKAFFKSELTQVEQDQNGVTATILDRETGLTRKIYCDYMIAADGARSPVRNMLEIPFEGPAPLSRQINIYFRAPALAEVVKGREFSLCVIKQPNFIGIFVSINGNDLWVFHVKVDFDAKAEDFTEDQYKQIIRRAAAIPDLEIELKGTMAWDAMVKIAKTYKQGRILLSGDSAHVMPPWGGFGANTGIQDAHNLTWKLYAVLKGQAGPALLDTYQIERQPVAKRVSNIAASFSDETGLITFSLWKKVRSFLNGFPFFVVGYGYSSSAIKLESGTPPGVGSIDLNGRPGTRIPHHWIKQDGMNIALLDLFNILISTVICGPNVTHTKENEIKKVSNNLNIDIRILKVGVDFTCTNKNMMSSFGVKNDGLVLVRPDGFVAWRVKTTAEETSFNSKLFSDILKQIYSRV